jgi:hypothetical protein
MGKRTGYNKSSIVGDDQGRRLGRPSGSSRGWVKVEIERANRLEASNAVQLQILAESRGEEPLHQDISVCLQGNAEGQVALEEHNSLSIPQIGEKTRSRIKGGVKRTILIQASKPASGHAIHFEERACNQNSPIRLNRNTGHESQAWLSREERIAQGELGDPLVMKLVSTLPSELKTPCRQADGQPAGYPPGP